MQNLLLAAVALLAILSTTAVAQTASESGPATDDAIDTITVVGSTTNADILAADLQLWQANDLADVFRTVPSVSAGGSLGIAQKIYIRGLEDKQLSLPVSFR